MWLFFDCILGAEMCWFIQETLSPTTTCDSPTSPGTTCTGGSTTFHLSFPICVICSVLGFISALVARFHRCISMFLPCLSICYLPTCLLFLSLFFFLSVVSAVPLWICMSTRCTASHCQEWGHDTETSTSLGRTQRESTAAWSMRCLYGSLLSELPVALLKSDQTLLPHISIGSLSVSAELIRGCKCL